MPERHRLLARQIKKHLGEGVSSPELETFIEAVDRAYHEFDDDRLTIERSMELSSQELFRANADLRATLSQLGSEKTLLQNILSSIPHCVFWKNLRSVYLGCNENFAKFAGLASAAAASGKTDEDLAWGAQAAAQIRKADREVMEKGAAIFNAEETRMQADGKEAQLLISKVPLRAASGEITGMLGIFSDISERKRMESRLLQSQKIETVGTLAGGIAHDLNNQLTPLLGYLDLLCRTADTATEEHKLLTEASQAAARCADVVRRLLNFSRPSTQKKTVFQLDWILEELAKLLPKFLPSTIRMEVGASETLWPILGNETEVQSVLMNLAANARDAMPAGGTLSIRARNAALSESQVRPGFPAGRYVAIRVEDTGTGIPPHVLTRIFEPFFTTKKVGQGTGLGLAMAFNIVKDHKGWLDVTSGIGKGTCFEIYLPATEKLAPKPEPGPVFPAVKPGANGRPSVVLVADDEETVRNLARHFLERMGCRVLLAGDGLEAVDLFRQNGAEISAVLLDVTMPRMTGPEALKKILEIDPKACVILSSGYAAETTPQQLIGAGAKAFIPKPYTIDELAQALQPHLARR